MKNKLSGINANRVSHFLQWRDWFLHAAKKKYWEREKVQKQAEEPKKEPVK